MAVLKKCQMRIGSRYLIEIEINVDNIIFFVTIPQIGILVPIYLSV